MKEKVKDCTKQHDSKPQDTKKQDTKRQGAIREIRDQGAKLVFEDPILCAEFLNNCLDLDIVKNITPGQITNISSRFVSLWDEERDSDIVNKIRLFGDKDLYFIALVEHHSQVAFDIMNKLLRYMQLIWTDYEKEMEKKVPGITRTKQFKYPPILPIVYYEGTGVWTAPRRLSERMYLADIFKNYIPDFTYELVRLHDYSNETIIGFGNELSLIMLINKLRDSEEFKSLKDIPEEYFKNLETQTPDYLLKLISTIVSAFLHRMNVPNEEIAKFSDLIKERQVRMLFDSFEAYDVQETRRISREEGLRQGIRQGVQQGIREGVQQGIQQCVLDFLEELGEVPADLREQIAIEKDIDVLKHWHKLAAQARDINEFIAMIS